MGEASKNTVSKLGFLERQELASKAKSRRIIVASQNFGCSVSASFEDSPAAIFTANSLQEALGKLLISTSQIPTTLKASQVGESLLQRLAGGSKEFEIQELNCADCY